MECVACLTLCAASVEALVNFMGYARSIEWRERASAPEKLEALYKAAGIGMDLNVDPLLSIEQLRGFRNSVMHSKPEISDAVKMTEDGYPSLDESWMEGVTPERCRNMYDQTKVFQRTFYDALNIEIHEEMSSAVASVSLKNAS